LDDVKVEIVDAENAYGFLAPLNELKFLPRVGDTLAMPPKENSTEKHQGYEVVDVNFRFGTDSTSRGKLLGIS
jgi:hypothetical protein